MRTVLGTRMVKSVTRRGVLVSMIAGGAGIATVGVCTILPGEHAPHSAANPAWGEISQQGELELSSPAILPTGQLPSKYGHMFQNVNPPLRIDGVPAGAQSLALIMEGPDVPGGAITYWLVWNIPPTIDKIPKGWTPPSQVVQGANSSGESDHGYVGPSPPNRQTVRFKLYAVDTTLDLSRSANKQSLGKAIDGHIIAQTQLTAWYDFHTPAHDSISRREHVNLIDDLCGYLRDRIPIPRYG